MSFVGRPGGYDCAGECGAGSALDSRCGDEGDREDGWRGGGDSGFGYGGGGELVTGDVSGGFLGEKRSVF